MHVLRDGYAGFAPVGADLTNVALVVPERRAGEMRGDASRFMATELNRHAALAARVSLAERAGPVRVIGPFNWSVRRAWAPGLALVGDAAGFFDPFTGEGMYEALRGAELLASYAFAAIRAASPRGADIALEAYDRCRRREFRGKWAVERIIAGAVESPGLTGLAVRAFAHRPELGHTLVGVTGDFVPASEVLRMRYILRLTAAALAPGSLPSNRTSPLPGSRLPVPD
jgi:flavin-dependent dehydrogenase